MKSKSYKALTLFDFQKLCESAALKRYTYSTFDQEWDSVMHTATLCFDGCKMLVQLHPGQIVFQSRNSELRFERVEYVRVYETQDRKLVRFGVVCGGSGSGLADIEYLLTAYS